MRKFPAHTHIALGTLFILLGGCADQAAPRPNIVLVTFDTTRADHLSCYGYEEQTSPNLDRLAEDGVRYDEAYSVSSWTLPAHASLFTGKFPSSHGAHYNPKGKINLTMDGGIKGNKAWGAFRANTIAEGETTLAEVLTSNGYATMGIIGGPWMKKVFGLGKGFQQYDDSNFELLTNGSELNGRTAEDISDRAISFVEAERDRPFFLFLNYYDPHAPYTLRRNYIREFWPGDLPKQNSWEWTLAQYDAEIKYTDYHFGRVLEHLRATGLYEDTLIIVTADHGELMGELNMSGHGNSLSQPEIKIPLLVKEPGPNRRRGADATVVQLVDILPTVLTQLELPLPPNIQGGTLSNAQHPIVAEAYPLAIMNDPKKKPWRQLGDWKSIIDGNRKFVWGSNGRHLLFDIKRDPLESRNLIAVRPGEARRLHEKMDAYFEGLPAPGEAIDVKVSLEDLEALRAMGYIGGEESK